MGRKVRRKKNSKRKKILLLIVFVIIAVVIVVLLKYILFVIMSARSITAEQINDLRANIHIFLYLKSYFFFNIYNTDKYTENCDIISVNVGA